MFLMLYKVNCEIKCLFYRIKCVRAQGGGGWPKCEKCEKGGGSENPPKSVRSYLNAPLCILAQLILDFK